MRRAMLFLLVGLMGCVTTTWVAEAQDSVREPGTKSPAAVGTPAKTDSSSRRGRLRDVPHPWNGRDQRGTIPTYCAARRMASGTGPTSTSCAEL